MSGPTNPAEYGDSDDGSTAAYDNDAELDAAGYASGLDLWTHVQKAYIGYYLRGDNVLGNAQLWSLREAIRAELMAELGL